MNEGTTARPTRLMHVVTVPQTFALLAGQTTFMAEHGFEVIGVSSSGPFQKIFAEREPIRLVTIEMPRRITPLADLVALVRLVREMRRVKPDIVHAHTPKGGLLGTIAAFIARVPIRIYHMRGLPMMTATGSRRTILRTTERISCGLASRVLCVSHSLRAYAIEERLCPAEKIVTLLGGTGNGIDAAGVFNPDLPVGDAERRRAEVRARYEIPNDALVVGFLGRIVRDKGVVELAEAWKRVSERFPTAHLIMAGPIEPQDPVPAPTLQYLQMNPRVHLIGSTDDPRAIYAASDVITLPTYREGLPGVPLEASAMRRPVVATRIPGCTDAVVDGETGLLVAARDAGALAEALERYLGDPDLRRVHGAAGRARVLRDFRRDRIWEATLDEYEKLLARYRSSISRHRSS